MTAPDEEPTGAPGLSEHSSVTSVRALYDSWAGLYDWNPVLELVRPARRAAVDAMELSPGDTVVDMGTGTGANLPYLREAVGPHGRVIGLDVSPRMLRRARALIEAEGWSNVTLLEGDIRDPPLTGAIEGILSAFVIVMYDQPDRLIERWANHLADGGSMAHLYAGPSTRRSAPVVNRLLSLYLRLFEEGWDVAGDGPSPLDLLVDRGDRVRSAMREHTALADHDDFAFGLAQLEVGHLDR